MKKFMIVAVLLAFGFAGFVHAQEEPKAEEPKAEESKGPKKGDKMTLIKIDKGEICDTTKSVLSKEKVDKGRMYSLKYTIEAGKGGFSLITGDSGLLKGKRGIWKDYDTLNVKYVLEGDKPVKASWLIGDQQSLDKWKYGNYCSKVAVLQPGEGVVSIDISGLVCDQGRQMDLENMRNMMLYMGKGGPEEGFVLYVQDVYLEKE
ncbi:MAG: hypothetical protein A2231_07055 [Candidatus Firestonebacteria bacterium RIFOXYA2_FULL_40_8]|nr:MAG: hypothetical protein A2231_07055 [Candidatus Firestonebacteria bacterium RIFOXYA2_FULL_40_8]